ncbi:MAG TPA: hypothetical protein VGM89_07320 [Puia sp.]
MKRKLYLLHRRLSIIIALPVLLWASSGLMHPIMTNIRPAVATQVYAPITVPVGRMSLSLDSVLGRRHIDSVAAVRLVHIDTNWFYQVRTVGAGAVPGYISCTNGKVLPMGDWLYAQWLARYFLEGGGSHGTAGGGDDCCGAATECVLHPAKGAAVGNVSLLASFDNEYKSINRLLPVYRVDFERADGIRIYVETTQDRFSFAMDRRRAVFDTFFRLCHLWGWLDWLGRGRMVVEAAVALTAFITAVLGIWIFFATRRKTRGIRRLHRFISIGAVLFTLFWSFSGGYHAVTKLTVPADPVVVPAHFAAGGLSPDWSRLLTAVGKPVTNWGMARIGKEDYWRINVADGGLCYVSLRDYRVLPEGDRQYAISLVSRYAEMRSALAGGAGGLFAGTGRAGANARLLTAFDDEYNFSDKRLPVWRVETGGPGHERMYVETCSGELAARVDAAVYAEGYSFSVFHKHHFMDWGGKKVRDASTIFWAAMQILLVAVGLLFFFRSRK